MPTVHLKKLSEHAIVPEYQSSGAAGFDFHLALEESYVLEPFSYALIPTGLAVAIPEGYEIQVRPRSGLAFKRGITVLNAPGTIDADYRGEIKVLLINNTDRPCTFEPGDRIAQGVLCEVPRAEFEVVEELPDTERGSGGFGSTGKAA